MKTGVLYAFLEKNCELGEHSKFIESSLITMASEYWTEGYLMSIRHTRKRLAISSKRYSTVFKRLLDYISDLTHQK